VCVTCQSADQTRVGTLLLDALKREVHGQASAVLVRPVQCLGVCQRPATLAVSAPDSYTFVFGDLDLRTGPAAVATFVASYRAADYGFVPWRARPEALHRGLVARIPAAGWSPEDGRPPP